MQGKSKIDFSFLEKAPVSLIIFSRVHRETPLCTSNYILLLCLCSLVHPKGTDGLYVSARHPGEGGRSPTETEKFFQVASQESGRAGLHAPAARVSDLSSVSPALVYIGQMSGMLPLMLRGATPPQQNPEWCSWCVVGSRSSPLTLGGSRALSAVDFAHSAHYPPRFSSDTFQMC